MSDDLDRWLDAFFAAYYERRPVTATFAGVHAHDQALPDYSEAGVEATCREMERLRAAVPPAGGLSPARRLDREVALGALDTQLAEFRLGWLHRRNPALYTGEAIFGVIALFLRDFAPLQTRAESAIARLNGIPALLAQGRANLSAAPRAWTDKAIRECVGARAFLTDGLDGVLAGAGVALGALEPALRRGAAGALAAFDDFERFLRDQLSERDDPNCACGPEFFNLLMRRGHFLEEDGDDLIAYGRRRLEELKSRLAEVTRPVRSDADWAAVFADLAHDHPAPEAYLDRFHEVWDACKTASDRHRLLTWPDYPLRYAQMPVPFRSCAPHLYFLPYRSPAPFDPAGTYTYLVPFIDGLPPEQQASRLRATNNSVITLNHVVHHGAIGHHVQNWNAYRGPSRTGAMAAVDSALRIALISGGTMAEGWACYVTDLMDEVGFYSPAIRVAQVQSQVRQAARCVADASLHLGRMSLDEAAAFYEREAGMPGEAAKAEAVKNSMFPGAAVMYLIGTDAVHALRREVASRQGSAFDLGRFHDAFLSYGSSPVALIRRMMLDEAGQPGRRLAN